MVRLRTPPKGLVGRRQRKSKMVEHERVRRKLHFNSKNVLYPKQNLNEKTSLGSTDALLFICVSKCSLITPTQGLNFKMNTGYLF